MRTIAAGELKRRGLAALQGLLSRGPVHVLQHNRPACVVLSPEAYARLEAAAGEGTAIPDVWSLLTAPPTPGGRSKAALDADIADERGAWDLPGNRRQETRRARRRR